MSEPNERPAIPEMTEAELEQEQENERLNGCCECGELGHGCNDCPTFGGPGTQIDGSEGDHRYNPAPFCGKCGGSCQMQRDSSGS